MIFFDRDKDARLCQNLKGQKLFRPIPRLRGASKWIAFAASAALVGVMLAAGWNVKTHPLDQSRYIVPDAQVSELELRDLIDRDDFIYLGTLAFLTTTGSNQTYTSDSTWNNSSNTVECLGAGGSGGVNQGSVGRGTGGGGGAYAAIVNFSFAVPGTTTATYRVAAGGTVNTRAASTNGATDGNDPDTHTYFNSAVATGGGSDNTKCGAESGDGGNSATTAVDTTGGAGGLASNSWGQTTADGGDGGDTAGTGAKGTGGGGAAGPAGAGGDGTDALSNGTAGTTGGSANNGTTAGGAGADGTGAQTGTSGSSGTEFDGTHGCGSGGGAARGTGNSGTQLAGAGAIYGGASGGVQGAGNAATTSPAAGNGLIVLEWADSSLHSYAHHYLQIKAKG